MSDEQTRQQLRTQAQAIAERVKADPDYLRQIREDPMSTLTAAGIPEHVINELVEAKSTEPDVEGYRYIDDVCNDGTCWTSVCPECCYVTF